jgi:GT2 family glycosyltransferase
MLDLDIRYSTLTNLERSSHISLSRLEYSLASGSFANKRQPGLSVVLLTKDRPQYILPLLKQLQSAVSFFKNRDTRLDIFLGDTGSTDSSVLAAYSGLSGEVQVELGLDYHFSKNNNKVAFGVQTSHILFLNNDILFSSPCESLWALYSKLVEAYPEDVFGAQMTLGNGRCQHSGIYFSRHEKSWALPYHLGAGDDLNRLETTIEVPAVTGAFLAIHADRFFELGGFEEFYCAECQDVDLCLKARRVGGKCYLLNLGGITHFENGTREIGEMNVGDRAQFLRRWQASVEEIFLLAEHAK